MAITMTVLFVVLACLLVGSIQSGNTKAGVMLNTNNSMHLTSAIVTSQDSFRLAESGVNYALAWLNEQSSAPTGTSAFAPTLWGTWTNAASPATVTYSSTRNFTIMIFPNPSNGTTTTNQYMVEAIGTSGGMQTILHAYLGQNNFGNYAYFTDNSAAGTWWVAGLSTIDGPMHCNNTNGTQTNVLWSNAAGKQWLTYKGSNAYTCSAKTINWALNNTGNSTAPVSTSDWAEVSAGGAGSVQTNVSSVAMPTTTSLEKNAALGTASVPTNNGIVVSSSGGATNGGIYVHGAVTNMTLSVVSNTHQVITINQTGSDGYALTTVVTINPTSNTTTTTVTSGRSQSTTTTLYSGTTNGVVYADAGIGSSGTNPGQGLSGVIADNTVVVIDCPVDYSENIKLTEQLGKMVCPV